MTRSLMLFAGALARSGCAHHHRLQPLMPPPSITESAQRAGVARTLDALHDAASKAEGDRYFAQFAPGAVFLGTDATERWTLDEFKAYARPLFAQGKGWTYAPLERHVGVSPDGWAWFDELLDNAKYGRCRGSGILRYFDDGRWLVVQYDLSVPIPNDLLPRVADEIRNAAKPAK